MYVELQNHPAKASDVQLGWETNIWKRNKIQLMGDKLKKVSRGLQSNPSKANTDTEQGWETHGKAIQQSLFTNTSKKMQIELQTHPAKDIKKDKMVLRVFFWSFGRQDQSLDWMKDPIRVRYREHELLTVTTRSTTLKSTSYQVPRASQTSMSMFVTFCNVRRLNMTYIHIKKHVIVEICIGADAVRMG